MTKCLFAKKSLTFLGHLVSGEGIGLNPKKTEVLYETKDEAFIPIKFREFKHLKTDYMISKHYNETIFTAPVKKKEKKLNKNNDFYVSLKTSVDAYFLRNKIQKSLLY